MLDVTPRQLLRIGGRPRCPARYARRLRRFRYGPGVCKVDWALTEPIPWAHTSARAAGTVHVGGTAEEITASEAEVHAGRHPERPYVLVVQPTVMDPTPRAGGRPRRVGLLPRAQRLDRRPHRRRSRPTSSGSRRASATSSSPGTR